VTESDHVSAAHVTARDASVLHRIIIDTAAALSELPRADFSTISKDAAELVRSSLISVSGRLQGSTGLRFDGSTAVIISAAIDPVMIATEGRLGDKGWTPGVFAVLCDSAHTLIDGLESLSTYYRKHPPAVTAFAQSEGINPDPEIVNDPESVPATETNENATDAAVLTASICVCINVVLQVCSAVVAELNAVGTAIQDAAKLDGSTSMGTTMSINYFEQEDPNLNTAGGAAAGAAEGDAAPADGAADGVADEVDPISAEADIEEDFEGDDDGSAIDGDAGDAGGGDGDPITDDATLNADDGDV
jgi:hypothetical protein